MNEWKSFTPSSQVTTYLNLKRYGDFYGGDCLDLRKCNITVLDSLYEWSPRAEVYNLFGPRAACLIFGALKNQIQNYDLNFWKSSIKIRNQILFYNNL